MKRSAAAFFAAMALCALAGCGAVPATPETAAGGAAPETAVPRGDLGAAALREASAFAALGPKAAGTPEGRAAADWIAARLATAGVAAETVPFEDATPAGTLEFRNVVARLPGAGDGIVVLGAHFDTKTGIEGFVGANDSGSGTGLLLALAPVLAAWRDRPFEVRLAFFDGEECQVQYGSGDGLHGSRRMAQSLAESGEAVRVAVMLLADMVGDASLDVRIPRNGDPDWTRRILRAAEAEGVRRHFGLAAGGGTVLDDHLPFLQQGIPAVDLIDFTYGSAPGKNDYWHTAADTPDKLSADSLDMVGRVILRALRDFAAE
jgi:hypothetical protein